MKTLYSHINYLKKTHSEEWVLEQSTDIHQSIQYRWYPLTKVYVRLTKYEPIFILLGRLMHVRILRSPKSLEFGIYMVGKEALVLKTHSLLETIIKNIEKATRLAPNNREKALMAYIKAMNALIPPGNIGEYYSNLIDEFISETPSLKIKKSYKW